VPVMEIAHGGDKGDALPPLAPSQGNGLHAPGITDNFHEKTPD
jgi:hypothetical protein